MSEKAIFIAIPALNGMFHAQCVTSLLSAMRILNDAGVPVVFSTKTDTADIAHARNLFCAEFLDTDCTHLMFIDADQRWRAEDILRMMSHELPIVAGAVPVKAKREGLAQYVGNLHHLLDGIEGKSVVRATEVGTGFMLIERRVLMTIGNPHTFGCATTGYEVPGAIGTIPIQVRDFFDWDIDEGKRISEDFAFCRKANMSGFSIWLDTLCELSHIGRHEWTAPTLHQTLRALSQGKPEPDTARAERFTENVSSQFTI